MPFAYYQRLSRHKKQIYDQSNAKSRFQIRKPERLHAAVTAIQEALEGADRRKTETAVQAFTTGLLHLFRVPEVKTRVLAKRPSKNWGELHGLYEPSKERGSPAVITVWMRTAQRKDIVAFKTFFRTLLHEIGHHLDYEFLQLEDSMHTEGFYKRESSLFYQLVPGAVKKRPPANANLNRNEAGDGRKLHGKGEKPAALDTWQQRDLFE